MAEFELREQIKKLRKTCGYSQQSVADALGIDRTTYSCYERGVIVPNAVICLALARLYNLRVAELIDPKSDLFRDDEPQISDDGKTNPKIRSCAQHTFPNQSEKPSVSTVPLRRRTGTNRPGAAPAASGFLIHTTIYFSILSIY